MNPVVLKVGVCVIVSAAALLFFFLKRAEPPQYTNEYPYSYINDDPTTCCICLEDIDLSDKDKVFVLPCRHKLHRDCLRELFSGQEPNNRRCPYCRRKINESVASSVINSTC